MADSSDQRDGWSRPPKAGGEQRPEDLNPTGFGRPCMQRRSPGFALILIVAGVLLFLGNLGILPIRNIWQYWPVVLIAIGFSRLLHRNDARGFLISLLFVLFGTLFLLLNLGIIRVRADDDSWPLSLLLIAFGCAALFGRFDPVSRLRYRRHWRRRAVPFYPTMNQTNAFSGNEVSSEDDVVSDLVFMGSLIRKVESHVFRGGQTTSILGNIELDLRRAIVLPNQPATIDVTAIFAATKIRVPSSWRVQLNGAAVLGNFEDKTIPPNTGRDAPTLIITGHSIFASVEIED